MPPAGVPVAAFTSLGRSIRSIGSLVRRSQIRTVWSQLPVTAMGWLSSWAQATAVTGPVWPGNRPMGMPLVRSQIRTVWSRPLVTAIGRPSRWVQATADTRLV